MAQCSRKGRNWQCSNEAAPGLKKCDKHLGQGRLHRKTWEQKREDANRCNTPKCKAHRLPGGSKCMPCREDFRVKYGRGVSRAQASGEPSTGPEEPLVNPVSQGRSVVLGDVDRDVRE